MTNLYIGVIVFQETGAGDRRATFENPELEATNSTHPA
jgi:hypothetical protein